MSYDVYLSCYVDAFYSIQEKAANAMFLASGHVRWVMGPSGTTITFPNEMGLPSIFESKSCRYTLFSFNMKVLPFFFFLKINKIIEST